MMPFLGLLSAFTITLICYSNGILLGYLLDRIKLPLVELIQKDYLERQLRAEIRDLISKLILEILERGGNPNLVDVTQQCPEHLRGLKAWKIWTDESYTLLKNIMVEDSQNQAP
ncbi:MAG TPA: hypothetical protein V6D03_04500 [Candidatus Caenarcaniphilales bacterium]